MNQANTCIKCEVKNCKYHCEGEDYYSRNAIQMGMTASKAAIDQAIDYQMF